MKEKQVFEKLSVFNFVVDRKEWIRSV